MLNALKNTKSIAITFSKQTKTNIQGFNLDLANHYHEEAETLLVLHAIDVEKSNPFQECIVVSPDTDIFLLLVHYYEQLPNSAGFQTGCGKNKRTISVQQCFEALGSKWAEAILGFHVLTGCNQIGCFSGKSKSSWWREFLKCNEDALIDLAKLGDGRSITQSFNIWQHWKVRCCYLRTEKEIRKYWNACSAPLVLLFQISIWHSTTTTNDECIEVQNILQPFCLYGFKTCSSPYSEFTISWKILMGIEW